MAERYARLYDDLPYPTFKRPYTEFIGVGDNGHLWVEGRDCVDLAAEFGTPLYVLSENQFRHNIRRFRDAFRAHYPDVEVLFANKSNNALAVRHIMNQEGAGGDCFGINELYLALLAGTDPKTLVLNGSNKTDAEIERAILNGVCINLDAVDEPARVNAIASRLDREVEVGIRIKPELKALEERFGADTHGGGSLAQQGRQHKWGMTLPQTVDMVTRIRADMPRLHLKEIHYHLGRASNVESDFAEMARDVVNWMAAIRDATGWTPPCIDIGGGWPWGRPEKTGPNGADDGDTPSYEDFAAAVGPAIKDRCKELGVDLPTLRLEPGRAISACAGVTLGRVGAVKDWPGVRKWVNVDCSTNHIIRIINAHWYHHIVAANKADAEPTETVTICGPLCSLDHLGEDRSLPALERGDLVALLDTGSYGESTSANYNAELRPATVMVSGDHAEVTTARERLDDVVGRFRVPAHLLGRSFNQS